MTNDAPAASPDDASHAARDRSQSAGVGACAEFVAAVLCDESAAARPRCGRDRRRATQSRGSDRRNPTRPPTGDASDEDLRTTATVAMQPRQATHLGRDDDGPVAVDDESVSVERIDRTGDTAAATCGRLRSCRKRCRRRRRRCHAGRSRSAGRRRAADDDDKAADGKDKEKDEKARWSAPRTSAPRRKTTRSSSCGRKTVLLAAGQVAVRHRHRIHAHGERFPDPADRRDGQRRGRRQRRVQGPRTGGADGAALRALEPRARLHPGAGRLGQRAGGSRQLRRIRERRRPRRHRLRPDGAAPRRRTRIAPT